jgi:predicted dehydrogenase
VSEEFDDEEGQVHLQEGLRHEEGQVRQEEGMRLDSRLRFGIVGAGVIGPSHATAIGALEQAELVAVADPSTEARQRMAERFRVQTYASLGEMLASERLDVVDICTPSGLHRDAAVEAMRAGCHVLVEKPIEIRLDRIDEMLRVQEETGVKLGVVFQHRFDPAAQQIHALMREGAFGRPVLGNAHILWWRSQKYYDSGAWRGTWSLDGGGVLMNQGIHSIDLLQWLMGPVEAVKAYTGTLAHRIETEDMAVATLRFKSGALGTVVGTTAAYPGVTTRVEVFGDRGSAIIADDTLAYLHLARDETEAPGDYGAAGWGSQSHAAGAASPTAIPAESHVQPTGDMIRAILEDGTPMVDGRAARHSVAIIRGIYESAQTGREVIVE